MCIFIIGLLIFYNDMKQLNLYPYYEELIRSKKKTTTVRLGNNKKKYNVGDAISITVGWNEIDEKKINQGVIVDVKIKKINELNDTDLIGESPDCLSKDSVKYVISSIYRKVVTEDDYVTIIKWKYDHDK